MFYRFMSNMTTDVEKAYFPLVEPAHELGTFMIALVSFWSRLVLPAGFSGFGQHTPWRSLSHT